MINQNLLREKIIEFEEWLMNNIVGYKNDGNPIPIPRELDENTMLIYHVKQFDRIFVVEKDHIPERFLINNISQSQQKRML